MVQCASFRRGLSSLLPDLSPYQTLWVSDQAVNEAWSSFCRSALQRRSLQRRFAHSRSYVSVSSLDHRRRHRWTVSQIDLVSATRAGRAGCWTQCRHGSSVPGPLQGMRRTSLFRRMMNASRPRVSGQSMDIDTLLGIDLQKSPEPPHMHWQGDAEILTCTLITSAASSILTQ